MANIRLTCPTCATELEVDAVHEGEEVECGTCLRVFVARGRSERSDPPPAPRETGRPSSEPRDRAERNDEPEERPARRRPPPPARRSRRPNRRPRRREDDDFELPEYDDEGDDDYGPADSSGGGTGNALAVTALVLGLVSVCLVLLTFPFACCCTLLPLPLTMPLSLAAVITGAFGLRGDPDRKPLAVVGLVLGALCLVFATLQLAFGIIPWMNAGR
jgi:hypothetical protein